MTINVFGGGNSSAPVFPVQRSVRLRSSASAYFNRTPATATNRKTWTWSGWVKRGTSGSYQYLLDAYVSANIESSIRFTNTDNLQIYQFNASAQYNVITSQVFRDPSSWYHIFVAFDTTQASSSDRVKVYVNGVQVTAFSTEVYPSLNFDSYINNTYLHSLGRASNAGGVYYFDGYLTEVNFIDGQALTPTSFGSYNSSTGVWQPIKYSGTYGTNGFYLNFQDNSAATAAAIGKDSSGNGNNWTPNNISVTAGVTYDSMLDVPTLTGTTNANFATLNPLTPVKATLSNANLTAAGGDRYSISTIGMDSGKWYCEMTVTTVGTESSIGIATAIDSVGSAVGNNSWSWGYYSTTGNKYTNSTQTSYGSSYTSGDVIGCSFDADTRELVFYKNGVSQGVAFTGLAAGTYYFAISGRTTGTANNCSINFGQRPFAYTPPTGFKSLNTYNLPDSTIPSGATQFAATTYTGTGSSLAISNTVNGKSFQPDLVWTKARSTTYNHSLVDSVRGVSKSLQSNLTNAEDNSAGAYVTAFNSDGFTVGTGTASNNSGSTYVAWQWKAGGAAVTNTSGSISSQVSANPSAGFSIVTYTGTGANATVGHGLGVAPKMVIAKSRGAAGTNWGVWHTSLTAYSYYLLLNSTAAQATAGTTLQSLPSSTVVSVGSSSIFNDASTMVMYCFSEIAGYSKFGSYTGNGSTDGPFVYLGFRPRWVMIKNTTTAGYNWTIFDTSRIGYNTNNYRLFPNLSNAEDSTTAIIDILSNGFKLRNTDAGVNVASGNFIYAAFAESPFKVSLAR